MDQEPKQEIILAKCKESPILRFIVYVLWVLMMIILFRDVFAFFLLMLLFGIYGIESWPDVTITTEGVFLKTPFRTQFIEWQKIKRVEKDLTRTLVYTRKYSYPLFPRFVIMGWHSNYKDIVRILKEKTGKDRPIH